TGSGWISISRSACLLAIPFSLLLGAGHAFGQTGGGHTWSGAADSDFYNDANWTSGNWPNGNATFGPTGGSNTTVVRSDVDYDYLYGLYFTNTTDANGNYTISGNRSLFLANNVATTTMTSGTLNEVVNNNITRNPDNGYNIGASHDLTLNGVISAGQTLVKNGLGTLTLGGTNTYTTATTVTAGTLEIGGAGSLGSGSYAGTIANSGTFEYNSSANQTLSGVISGTGSVVKGNTGTLTLTGANTYTGATFINEGTLAITNATALGSTVGETTINTNAKLNISGGITTAENITNVGGGGGKITGGTGGGTFTGLITLTNGIDLRGNDLTFSGGVTSTDQGFGINGAGYVIDTVAIDLDSDDSGGAGTFGLTSAGNSKANATELNVGGNDWGLARINFGGYLKLGGDNYMPADAGVEFGWNSVGASSGTLDLNGFDQTVAFLRQTAIFPTVNGDQNITGGGTLTIDTAAGTYDYHGRITDGATATSLVKAGTGTQILSNNTGIASNYTGTTDINGGVLELQSTNGFFGLSSNVHNINNGSTLRFSVNGGNGYILDATDTINFGSSGGGLMDAASGNFVVRGSTITTTGGAENTIQGSFNMDQSGPVTFNVADGTDASDLTVSSTISNQGSILKSGSGTMTLTGANTYTGTSTVNGGVLELNESDNTYHGGAININNGATLRMSNQTGTYLFGNDSFNFGSNGGGTYEIVGGHNHVWSSNNTVTTNGGSENTITGSSINTNSGGSAGTITFNVADGTGASDLTVSSIISNQGSILKSGSGTMKLTANNTYTGTTTVSEGTLIINGDHSAATGAVNVGGGILDATLAGSGTLGGTTTIGANGFLSPGNSPGTQTFDNLTWVNSGTYLWEINADLASGGGEGVDSGWDWIDVTNTFDLSGITTGFNIDITSLTDGNIAGLADGFDNTGKSYLDPYESFTILSFTSLTGTFDASEFNLLTGNFANPKVGWNIDLVGTDLVLNAVFVPEPSSTALLGLGGLALMLRRKRS
ncbi:autotransporter-associated beta strand repeat-containing protein, partial [Akkermansiaceae bacterium]|nr:autotransporter-associated beta strand repeat-containing protein [Akkermansiaceae bacterium]